MYGGRSKKKADPSSSYDNNHIYSLEWPRGNLVMHHLSKKKKFPCFIAVYFFSQFDFLFSLDNNTKGAVKKKEGKAFSPTTGASLIIFNMESLNDIRLKLYTTCCI